MYVAKIEVSDLDAMVSFLGTDEGKEFVKSWSVFINPKTIFTQKMDSFCQPAAILLQERRLSRRFGKEPWTWELRQQG
jgi:hypothetical protein